MKEYKFKINGNPYKVNVLDSEGNLTKIEVNGTSYDVEYIPEAPKLKPIHVTSVTTTMKDVTAAPAAKSSGAASQVKAPLPGIIVQVLVRVGDNVAKDQSVCTLETMKMENAIKAENSGVVTAVNVTPGQTVNQDEVLIEIK